MTHLALTSVALSDAAASVPCTTGPACFSAVAADGVIGLQGWSFAGGEAARPCFLVEPLIWLSYDRRFLLSLSPLSPFCLRDTSRSLQIFASTPFSHRNWSSMKAICRSSSLDRLVFFMAGQRMSGGVVACLASRREDVNASTERGDHGIGRGASVSDDQSAMLQSRLDVPLSIGTREGLNIWTLFERRDLSSRTVTICVTEDDSFKGFPSCAGLMRITTSSEPVEFIAKRAADTSRGGDFISCSHVPSHSRRSNSYSRGRCGSRINHRLCSNVLNEAFRRGFEARVTTKIHTTRGYCNIMEDRALRSFRQLSFRRRI